MNPPSISICPRQALSTRKQPGVLSSALDEHQKPGAVHPESISFSVFSLPGRGPFDCEATGLFSCVRPSALLRFSAALLLRLPLRFLLRQPRFQAAQSPGVFPLLRPCVFPPLAPAFLCRFLPHSRAAFDPSLRVVALAFAARVLPVPLLASRCLAFAVAWLSWGWWVLGLRSGMSGLGQATALSDGGRGGLGMRVESPPRGRDTRSGGRWAQQAI